MKQDHHGQSHGITINEGKSRFEVRLSPTFDKSEHFHLILQIIPLIFIILMTFDQKERKCVCLLTVSK